MTAPTTAVLSGVNSHHWFSMVKASADLTFQKVTDPTPNPVLRSCIIFMRFQFRLRVSIFDAAPTPILLYTKPTFSKQTQFKMGPMTEERQSYH
jgi:hypothetical protein